MSRVVGLLPFLALLAGCGGFGLSHGSSEDRRSLLEKAVQERDLAEVTRLLDSGADPNDRGGVYGSPLYAAASRGDNVEVIRMLVSAGANPHGRGQEGNRCWGSPLLHAASSGAVENTRALLDAGASIEQAGCSKLTVGWLKAPIVDLLVERGLNLKAVDENGRNQLHVALAPPVVPPLEGIEYLVRAGVPLNARDRYGKTPPAYWREPHSHEIHWFWAWLLDRLSGGSIFRRDRENHAEISAFLEQAGATL